MIFISISFVCKAEVCRLEQMNIDLEMWSAKRGQFNLWTNVTSVNLCHQSWY